MSEANVETVRALWAALVDEDMPAALAFIDEEVVYEDDILPDHAGETYVGYEGIERAWAGLTEPWETFENRLSWARGAGDAVVSFHRARGRGKGSGIEIELGYAYVWRFRAGKVSQIRAYRDSAEALAVAGIAS